MDWDEIQNHIYYGQPRGCAPTAAVLLLLLTLLLGGCKHIEYVPIETTHTIEHHHTDSVRQVDSIFKNKETIIMQLDSEAMAQYGIRLQAAEKAWLVRTAELEKQLQKLLLCVLRRVRSRSSSTLSAINRPTRPEYGSLCPSRQTVCRLTIYNIVII